MKGAIRRWIQRKLSMAWEKWQYEHAQAAEMRRRRLRARAAIQRWMHRELSKALQKWLYEYEQAKRQLFLLNGAATRFRNQLLSKAWEKWQFEAAALARERYMASGALARMRNRQLSLAWEKWQFEAAALARERYMASGALARMRNRQLSRAFEKWQFEAAALARERYMVGGALNRMRNFHLSRAWEKWQFEAGVLSRQRYMAAGALNRMRNFQLSRAFEKWQLVAQLQRPPYKVDATVQRTSAIEFIMPSTSSGSHYPARAACLAAGRALPPRESNSDQADLWATVLDQDAKLLELSRDDLARQRTRDLALLQHRVEAQRTLTLYETMVERQLPEKRLMAGSPCTVMPGLNSASARAQLAGRGWQMPTAKGCMSVEASTFLFGNPRLVCARNEGGSGRVLARGPCWAPVRGRCAEVPRACAFGPRRATCVNAA